MNEKDYIDIKFKLFEALSKHKDAMNVLCKYARSEVGLLCHKVIEKQIERELFFINGYKDRTSDNVITFPKGGRNG